MNFTGKDILKLWRFWQDAKSDAEWHRQALERQGRQLTAAHKRIAVLEQTLLGYEMTQEIIREEKKC